MKKGLFILGLFGIVMFLVVGMEWLFYKRVSDKECLPLVKKLLSTGTNLGDGMVYNYGQPYIARSTSLLLSKYFIKGIGKVPRNSEMDELIDKWIDSTDAAKLVQVVAPPPPPSPPPINYDSLCIVGNKYTLYPPNSQNPYEHYNAAHVTIVDKKNGYVQYCYTKEIKNDPTYFSRSCKDFIDLTKNPTKP